MEHVAQNPEINKNESHALHKLLLGTAAVAGAVILAPYVLPALGIGGSVAAGEAMIAMHTATLGTGIAAALNSMLAAVPFVGPTLAEGGLMAAAASGVVGIGGSMLGRFIEKRHNGEKGVNWGKVIAYGALATSALIAMPTILTSVSAGLVYLSAATVGVQVASHMLARLSITLGSIGMAQGATGGLGGLAATVPHLLTCGAAILPAALSYKIAQGADGPLYSSHARRSYRVSRGDAAGGPVSAEVRIDKPTSAFTQATGNIILRDARGQPITQDEIATTYGSKLHLYIADQSLRDYQHIHPEATATPGVFAFTFMPQTSNRYAVWTDLALAKDDSGHRIRTDIPAEMNRSMPALVRANSQAELGGLVFTWNTPKPLTAGSTSVVDVTVTDRQGNPVTNLEPIMGAYAHLVGFSADGTSLLHTHPLGQEPMRAGDRGGPILRFEVEPEQPGPTQFYLQVRKGGQDLYIPFGQLVRQPEQYAARQFMRTQSPQASPGLA